MNSREKRKRRRAGMRRKQQEFVYRTHSANPKCPSHNIGVVVDGGDRAWYMCDKCDWVTYGDKYE